MARSEMHRIESYRVGVQQGQVDLFSDFATGGDMWTGSGARERRQLVTFSEPFRAPPAVQVALSLWDMDSDTNLRADIGAEEVTKDGFVIFFRTWGDTRVARVRLSWMAIGGITDPTEWVVD